MRKFHSIAALCGDGLRPELQALFDRLAIDPHSELIVRKDGMLQSGPDLDSEARPPRSGARAPLISLSSASVAVQNVNSTEVYQECWSVAAAFSIPRLT
jgi:hypothetical protein